jgi:hypothetical protein
MFSKRIRIYLSCLLSIFYSIAFAQEDYKAEIGFMGGGAYYLGDANALPFMNTQPTYGGFFRYRFGDRTAAKIEFNKSRISSTATSFSNSVNAMDLCWEFNFFDLEQNPYKRRTRLFSTYIFGGLGLVTFPYLSEQSFNMSLPFGVGIKLKLADRINFNVQWSTRLAFTDKMEGVAALNNPANLNGSNFNNNDLLSTLTVGLSLDIWKNECDCKDKRN